MEHLDLKSVFINLPLTLLITLPISCKKTIFLGTENGRKPSEEGEQVAIDHEEKVEAYFTHSRMSCGSGEQQGIVVMKCEMVRPSGVRIELGPDSVWSISVEAAQTSQNPSEAVFEIAPSVDLQDAEKATVHVKAYYEQYGFREFAFQKPPETGTENQDFPDQEETTDTSDQACEALPGHWIWVEEDPAYGTDGFCLMKFEAKKVSESPASQPLPRPWTEINLDDSIAACQSLGQGYDLISNKEYMAAATAVASAGSNWTGGQPGSGQIYLGHSDGDPRRNCEASEEHNRAWVEGDCVPKTASEIDDAEGVYKRVLYIKNSFKMEKSTFSLFYSNTYTSTAVECSILQ